MKPVKYLDPTVDYAFKRIFGKETSKDALIAFLNAIFRGQKDIKDLFYNRTEFVGDTSENGTVIFDLTCITASGEQFIIEVQRSRHNNFFKRVFYYGSKLTSDQAPKGNRKLWNYDISEVYVVVIMDGFKMPRAKEDSKYLHEFCIKEKYDDRIYPHNFGLIFLELVNFTKDENLLDNDLDAWFFLLKNMSKLDKIPVYLKKPIFEKVFKIAEYSNLTKKERDMYNSSLKRKWDQKVVLDYAREEGKKKGEKIGERIGEKIGKEKTERRIIENLLTRNIPISEIASIVGVSVEFIEAIQRELETK